MRPWYARGTCAQGVEKKLEECGTDCADIGVIHCVNRVRDFEKIMSDGILDYARKLKRDGPILVNASLRTEEPEMAKCLIAYFSREGNNYVNGRIVNLPVGNTEVAAKTLERLTGGDLFKIDPVKKYSGDYRTCTEEAQQDLRSNARPELTMYPASMEQYDTVILGYPDYWGTCPMSVMTFLEKYDFSGKTILPFCTHEGSGMGRSEGDIKRVCPRAKVERGLAIRGGSVKDAEKEIERWLKNSGGLSF